MDLQQKESSELPALRKQLADTEKGIENMLNAIQAGIINDSTKRRLDELEATKQKLEASIIREEIKKPLLSRDQIRCFISSFREVGISTLEGRRMLIDRFVNSIVVYDDDILVTINYKDKTKRITFKEIESSDLSFLGGPNRRERASFATIFYCKSNKADAVVRIELLRLPHILWRLYFRNTPSF